jgi:hypothetical protein
MPDKIIETHETCTSTDLDKTPGSSPEHINKEVLNKLHESQTGLPISTNPVVARLQREQALTRDKMKKLGI